MLGPCKVCGHDPGFDFQICPECGWRPGAPAPGAAAPAMAAPMAPTVLEADAVARSNESRWDETQHGGAITGGREKPNFGRARDFYQAVGGRSAAPGGLRWEGGREDSTILDQGGRGGFEDDSDHTIIERRGRDAEGPETDSDATIIGTRGRSGVQGPLVYVIQRNGIRAGKVWLIGPDTVLGRKPMDEDGEAIVIADDTVSKRHAKIRLEEGRFMFWDLASANGSFLIGTNGTRERVYTPHPLADGDTIDLGDARLTYIEVEHEKDA